ncbi:YbaN family protein [Stappia indica]|jgi:uncharacterized membrane protein YbaN (DUF454 family)|uniref:YbaN family protein n=1 Tax=Stappia indica TaxID=538381 RepID=UPI0009F1F1A7
MTSTAANKARYGRPPRRHVWTALGWAALSAGAAGIVLPLVPTTPFVVLAAAAFGKGSPQLKRRLEDSDTFGPALARWRAGGAIAPRHKAVSVATMAAMFGTSLALDAAPWILAVQGACMSGAALFILTRPGTGRRNATPNREDGNPQPAARTTP